MINTTLVANTIQPKYSKKLLEHAVKQVRLVETAQQEELPAGIGATSIRFFRPPQADLTATGAPQALTEGTPINTFRDISYTPIDVTLAQRGQVAKVTDIANNVGLLQYLDGAIELMSEEFAEDCDTLIRNPLCHPTNGLTKRYAQSTGNFAGLAAASLAAGCVKPVDVLDSMIRLKINRAPTFGGVYVWHVPPQLARDILNDPDWQAIVSQNNADKIFNGEIGKLSSCRIVENTNPFQEDETEGTFASTFNAAGTNTTGLIFSSQIVGRQAYGTVNMKKAGSSLKKPTIIINDKADKADPLNQFITVGWKSYWASVVLNQNWGINLRAKSQFIG